jgi:hypothetical protein
MMRWTADFRGDGKVMRRNADFRGDGKVMRCEKGYHGLTSGIGTETNQLDMDGFDGRGCASTMRHSARECC